MLYLIFLANSNRNNSGDIETDLFKRKCASQGDLNSHWFKRQIAIILNYRPHKTATAVLYASYHVCVLAVFLPWPLCALGFVGLVVLGLVTLNSLASPAEGVRPAVATDAPAVVATAVGSRTPR